jgi:hypothetical protein
MLPLSSFTLVHNVGSGSTLAAGWINDAGQVHCITGTAAGN